MTLRELEPDTNVLGLKIRLTPELKESYENYSSKGEQDIYLVGDMMGDWFISPAPPNTEKRALYPMPLSVEPSDFLDCEIMVDESI